MAPCPKLKDQINEWLVSELAERAWAFAQTLKPYGEDALHSTLTERLQKGGEQTSPYPDIKALHAVILKSLENKHKDMRRNASARRRWEETRSERREDSTTRIDHPVEEEIRQETAKDLLLHLLKRSKPIERIVLLVDKRSFVTVSPSTTERDETLEFDTFILDQIKEAAAQLEPPVAASKIETWRTLQDVARSLDCPSASLRSIRKRLYAELQQSWEALGEPFEKWNNLVSEQ